MQNTKLIQLLKTLSVSEFREFKDFVRSPVFNKNKKILNLFDLIKDHYPKFDNESLKDDNVFKEMFPGEPYDYFKIKNIISDLFSLGKEYLAFLQYRDISNIKEKFLLEQLRDRSLDNIFEQTFKVYKKKLDSVSIRDENHVLKQLELTEELLSFQIPKDPVKRLDFFQTELDYFLTYSVIRLLKYYNIMLHEKFQNNCEFNMKMFDEVMSYLRKNPVDDNPTLRIYYNIILLSKDRDEKYFFELKKLKDKYIDELNAGDQYMLYLHMANYCAYVFNHLGRTDFMREHFLLSKENFDRGTIILGKILYPDFLNHVKIAVRVGEYEWAEKYISNFQHLLTEEKESTLNFCRGVINYSKGELDTALDLFSRANFPAFIIKIQVKILLLRIFYEKEFYDQAHSMLDSFRHFLLREKSFIENSKKSFYEFLKITNDLIKIKTSPDKKEWNYNVKRIKDEIEKVNFNQFGIKNWLEEKVNELKVES